MPMIETKFEVGEAVFKAGTTIVRKQHECPDCLGTRKWSAKSPGGGEYTFPCPRCGGGYMSNRDLSLDYSVHAPTVERLTIGQVRAISGEDAEYMCRETGIGSGTLHREKDLFRSEAEAQEAAKLLAAERTEKTDWMVKQYDAALGMSDYQLDSATLRSARDHLNHIKATTQILFEDLRDCETLDEVHALLDEGLKFREEAAQ